MALDSFLYILGGMTDSNTVTNSVEIYRNTLFATGERLEVNGNLELEELESQTQRLPRVQFDS